MSDIAEGKSPAHSGTEFKHLANSPWLGSNQRLPTDRIKHDLVPYQLGYTDCPHLFDRESWQVVCALPE